MLKKITKEYFISIGFIPFNLDGCEYLKKDYVGISLFNLDNELCDLVDITVYIEEIAGKWVISKCISLDEKKYNVFDVHFKSDAIKELVAFNRLHSL